MVSPPAPSSSRSRAYARFPLAIVITSHLLCSGERWGPAPRRTLCRCATTSHVRERISSVPRTPPCLLPGHAVCMVFWAHTSGVSCLSACTIPWRHGIHFASVNNTGQVRQGAPIAWRRSVAKVSSDVRQVGSHRLCRRRIRQGTALSGVVRLETRAAERV